MTATQLRAAIWCAVSTWLQAAEEWLAKRESAGTPVLAESKVQ